MYRLSPFTYLVSGMLSTGVANTSSECAANEFATFDPPANQTCAQYMDPYIQASGGGYLQNPEATSGCSYCSMSSTNQFLAAVDIYWKDAWRNFGLMWVYVIFNLFGALFLYWLLRVPKGKRAKNN